jgi:hypothetical protein
VTTYFQDSFHEKLFENPPECTEMNPDYFFADENDEEEQFGRSERAIAVAACKRCDLRIDCFQYAVSNEILDGVWGGSVPQQRIAYLAKVRLTQAAAS